MNAPVNAARRVVAAVILRAGRVLVQTRPQPGRYQGYWEFPGGGHEPGETAAECARRECLEELGLAIAVHESLHVERWSYPGVTVEVDFLRCSVEGAGEPRPLEGQELLWADADALLRLAFLPSGAVVLARLTGDLLT